MAVLADRVQVTRTWCGQTGRVVVHNRKIPVEPEHLLSVAQLYQGILSSIQPVFRNLPVIPLPRYPSHLGAARLPPMGRRQETSSPDQTT